MPTIKQGYEISRVIFYGKYLKTDTCFNYYDQFSKPYIVDNFEVLKVYKGISKISFEFLKQRTKNGMYNISLINSCKSSCGRCFEKDKNYIVYCYTNILTGQLQTDGCTRTREIINDDFTTIGPLDPDLNLNEETKLRNLAKADSNETGKTFFEINDIRIKQLNERINVLTNTVFQKNILNWTLGLLAFILIGIILFRYIKHK